MLSHAERKKITLSVNMLAACEMAIYVLRIKTNQKILLNYLPWFNSKHNSIITENC